MGKREPDRMSANDVIVVEGLHELDENSPSGQAVRPQ